MKEETWKTATDRKNTPSCWCFLSGICPQQNNNFPLTSNSPSYASMEKYSSNSFLNTKRTNKQNSRNHKKEDNILSWPHNLFLVLLVPLCSAKCRESLFLAPFILLLLQVIPLQCRGSLADDWNDPTTQLSGRCQCLMPQLH